MTKPNKNHIKTAARYLDEIDKLIALWRGFDVDFDLLGHSKRFSSTEKICHVQKLLSDDGKITVVDTIKSDCLGQIEDILEWMKSVGFDTSAIHEQLVKYEMVTEKVEKPSDPQSPPKTWYQG